MRRPARYPKRKVQVCKFCNEVYYLERQGSGALKRRPTAAERIHARRAGLPPPRERREYYYTHSHSCPGLVAKRAEMERSTKEVVRRLNEMLRGR